MIPGVVHRRQFKNLSDQEILALAISSEEDDARIYRWYAARVRADYPATARALEAMAGEEDVHRARLIEEHRRRFGEAIPLIRREHVAGFYHVRRRAAGRQPSGPGGPRRCVGGVREV